MNKWRPQSNVYRQEWIKHNGPIPLGFHIHHTDGDPWNNHISNLQCLSPWDHYVTHRDQGDKWAAATLRGKFENPNWDQNYYPNYGDHKLRYMDHGLIRVPTNAWKDGIRPPEVVLMGDLNWAEELIEYKLKKQNEIL